MNRERGHNIVRLLEKFDDTLFWLRKWWTKVCLRVSVRACVMFWDITYFGCSCLRYFSFLSPSILFSVIRLLVVNALKSLYRLLKLQTKRHTTTISFIHKKQHVENDLNFFSCYFYIVVLFSVSPYRTCVFGAFSGLTLHYADKCAQTWCKNSSSRSVFCFHFPLSCCMSKQKSKLIRWKQFYATHTHTHTLFDLSYGRLKKLNKRVGEKHK